MNEAVVSILCFQDTYRNQTFYQKVPHILEDLSKLQGTNRYCEEEAAAVLTLRLKKHPLHAIHFLGSGNYHYLSALWAGMIRKPFQLLLYDHHTDLQAPAFGDILSCGGWVLWLLETNPFLQKVILVGPDTVSFEAVPEKAKEKVAFISQEKLRDTDGSGWREASDQIDPVLPLYVSIDKDILDHRYAHTGWSQGDTSLDQLMMSVTDILTTHCGRNGELLGIDVCGEAEPADPDYTGCNEEANRRIISELYRFLD